MDVREFGRLIDVRDEQSLKAQSLISVIEFGRLIDVRAQHP